MAPTLRSPGSRPFLADINVTPLVDVMLVLLIIFMVTAPMMQRGIDVDLPGAEAAAEAQEDRWVVSIDRDENLYLNDRPIHLRVLGDRLQTLGDHPIGDLVYLRADREVPYGRVMVVMDTMKQAGVRRVGMVTAPVALPGRPDRRR
ncbi:MAG: ExbD/TolR family protein [Acidobacteria bacterium]|nr:ExbD/TolR family protein [Acidobacteriota bacterium]